MNTLFVIVLSFCSLNCNAFNIKDIGNKISELTSELGITGETRLATDEHKLVSDVCSQKCTKELQELKKNMTELYMAFLVLHAEFSHLNQHIVFHERALKHIAVWGHKPSAGHNDHNFRSDTPDMDSHNDSSLNGQQSEDSTLDLTSRGGHQHRHQMHHQIHHIKHPDHHHHSHDHGCHNHPNQGYPHLKDGMNKNNEKKDKDSSEESSEEQLKPLKSSVVENSDSNKTISLNESQTKSFAENGHKRGLSSQQSIADEMKFHSMEPEFKQWFDNMLNDIHHNHNVLNDRTVGESVEGLKAYKRSNPSKDNQKIVDEMETSLNSEKLVFATCAVRPNRHIALLNQQDIEGTINMWQIRHNRGPLHMHIKLKGFKVSSHENSPNHNHNQNHHKTRTVRDSNLMPVEQEPNQSNRPIGTSHSHGFHVHELKNLSRDCQSLGGHYNPLNLAHGGPYDVVRHVGDLGNIRCDSNGEIDAEFTYSQVSLSGEYSIINRSLVIHSNADDYGRNPNSPSSATTGSSGVRIACCVIQEVNQLPNDVDSQSSIGAVGGPADQTVVTSKRRRDTSVPELLNHNNNRFENSYLSEILKKIAKHENELKFKTLLEFNERHSQQRHRIRFED